MSTIKIEKIQRVDVRELWKREDTHFTRWLEENIDHLTDAIGFDITIESREEKVGPFRVDLYGEDENGNKVIIENQLEKTDHTHLGQILTYLTNLEAKTAIWISSQPVEEHKKVIDWLNEITPDDVAFYLIQLEAVRIGNDSTAAPLFTIVKKPDTEIKRIGDAKKEDAHRHVLLKEFWTQFLDRINQKSSMCENITPPKFGWLSVSLGMSDLYIFLVVTNKQARTEVYMDSRSNKDKNKRIFDFFFAKKEQIERDFGGELNWKRLDNNQISKIEKSLDGVNVSKKEDWDKISDFLIDHAIRMEKAFEKHVPDLRKSLNSGAA